MSNELFTKLLSNRDIISTKTIVKWLFPELKPAQNITNKQAYIVKRIAFSETKRISISAFTRYGKSQMVAIAICIFVLINTNKKIKIIGPTDEQASIIKDYIGELILGSNNNLLLNLADIEITHKKDRLKAEVSQKRITFKNGCEVSIVTAHGKGFSAMGKGGDVIIMDEASLISRESYAKITRMLGDDPENAVLIELYNPWDRDTKAYDHSISPRFERIQVDYNIGLTEGRITQEFVDEMREDMTPLEFKVLYDSEFPDESEDSLHNLKRINDAEIIHFGLLKELNELIEKYRQRTQLTEGEYIRIKKELERYKYIFSCDPADKGLDYTTMYWGISKDDYYYEIHDIYSEPQSESMDIVGRIMQKVRAILPKEIKGYINIDKIGIGTGPVSRVREIINEEKLTNVVVIGCNSGESALKTIEFSNKKAENNYRLKQLFQEGAVSLFYITKNKLYPTLKKELMSMKWGFTSTGKKKIIDPDKSPDYNDGLVFFIWRDKNELIYEFI